MSEPSKDTERSTDKPIRELTQDGYRIRLDISRQVLRLSSPPVLVDPGTDDSLEEAILYPVPRTVGAVGQAFIPAGLLIQKAKQFDDGLYAAVELAAQNGVGRVMGKATLLPRLVQALASQTTGIEAYRLMLAACRLGGLCDEGGPGLGKTGEATVEGFLQDEGESKPLGFYTWSPALEGIFRQDRLLQRRVSERIAGALVEALSADPELRAAYRRQLELAERLTNPSAGPDLRALLDAPGASPSEGVYFFPPAVSHEIELARRLYGDGGIPDDYPLMHSLIDAIRKQMLDVEPQRDSGWYDFQTWANAALLVPHLLAEERRLSMDQGYLDTLEALFKGAQTLARETFLKSLLRWGLTASPPEEPARPVLEIEPGLTVEPAVTFFERRAIGYRYLRDVLEDMFGATALSELHRLTPEGPVEQDLGTELSDMTALFRGARTTAAVEIGLTAAPAAGSDADVRRFGTWKAGIDRDVDLARDARMMVPVAHDRPRGLHKVWMFLGWSARGLHVDFRRRPAAEIFDAAGRRVAPGEDFELKFRGEYHKLLSPVTAELWVRRLLDRKEFRAHCDRHRTESEILAALL